MRKISLLLLICGVWGCSEYASTKKQTDVKTFSIRIAYAFFATEGGRTIVVTNQEIKRDTTITLKLDEEQSTQIKKALDKIPFKEIKKEYIDERAKDGMAISFYFDLDGKKYETHYINYPLHPKLEALEKIITKMLPNE